MKSGKKAMKQQMHGIWIREHYFLEAVAPSILLTPCLRKGPGAVLEPIPAVNANPLQGRQTLWDNLESPTRNML